MIATQVVTAPCALCKSVLEHIGLVHKAFICVLVSLGFFGTAPIRAQQPIRTTVCAVMANPSAFAGKIVKLRATAEIGIESSTISDPTGGVCDGPWLDFAPRKDSSSRLDASDAELQRLNPVFLVENEKTIRGCPRRGRVPAR
jgi:hypothetical protein